MFLNVLVLIFLNRIMVLLYVKVIKFVFFLVYGNMINVIFLLFNVKMKLVVFFYIYIFLDILELCLYIYVIFYISCRYVLLWVKSDNFLVSF